MIDRYARAAMKAVWEDSNKYDKWLAVEIASCEAWTSLGSIPEDDMRQLRSAQYNMELMDKHFSVTRHDMTAFTRSITDQMGPAGRWIHLGLTSSDVMDTALSMQVLEAADLLLEDIDDLLLALSGLAKTHKNTLMMGRTHGVHAEPTTFGMKLALWYDEFRRNRRRLEAAREENAVGKISGAVGSHATAPPELEDATCELLGLRVAPVSNQIIQRDRHAQFLQTIALIGASAEKVATEIRHLQRTEVREVEEPFGEGQTGSSAMPHKRNPELTERVCGLARVLRGYATTALENVALWHERDISHSSAERIIIPDACMALDYMLSILTEVLAGLKVYPERMKENLDSSRGLIFSQRVLLQLIDKGMSREEAYNIVQSQTSIAWSDGVDFRELIANDAVVSKMLSPEDFEELFDYNYYTRFVDVSYRRVGLE
jgi:adenylosuccinate lyase